MRFMRSGKNISGFSYDMRNDQGAGSVQPALSLSGNARGIGPACLNNFFSFAPGICAGFFHHPAGLLNRGFFSLYDKGPGISDGLINQRKGLLFSRLNALLSLRLGLFDACKGLNHG